MAKNLWRFDIEPYDAVLYLATTEKAFKKKRAEYTDKPIDLTNTLGMTSRYHEGSTNLVGIFEGGGIPTLTHELTHVAINVLESRGIPINEDTCEVMCYLMSNLMFKCLPHVPRT